MTAPRVVRAGEAVTVPWRNGGGSTREYVHDRVDGATSWRLSVAEVAADGPFSSFPGIDRILVLLTGAGMTLTGVAPEPMELTPLGAVRFRGEAEVSATLVDGPTTDLNLMWDRTCWSATVEVVEVLATGVDLGADVSADLIAAYVVSGSVDAGGSRLSMGDALVADVPLRLAGAGVVVVFPMVREGR